MTIIPVPPGVNVEFASAAARRFGPPDPSNLFVVGFFDRGTVGQVATVQDLITRFGAAQSYSQAWHSIAGKLAEGGRLITIARVVGPAAASATVTLNDAVPGPSITVTATSPGAWANGATAGLKAAITTEGSGRRLTITENGVTVAVSPLITAVADFELWDGEGIVTVDAVGTGLPANVAATNLAGGADDRANVTPDSWADAAALLDPKYGPGILYAPGLSDDESQIALAEHGEAHNRDVYIDLPADTTINAAITHAETLRTDAPDLVKRIGMFLSWARQTTIAGETTRLVPYAGVQAAITSRVMRENGPGAPAFGLNRGVARTVARLEREFTDAERNQLYEAGINVAVDDGAQIAHWGFRTLDLDPLHSDLHHAHVRMTLRWLSTLIARTFLAEPLDALTLASYAGKLDGLGQQFASPAVRALYGYVIDVDTVNTVESMARRELHALWKIQQTPTADWVDLLVEVYPTTTDLT